MLTALAFAAALFLQPAPVDGGAVVSADWLAGQPANKKIVLLYVGPRAEYDAGHIPGQLFMPNDAVTTTGANGLVVEFPSAEALEDKLEALGISDGSRVIVSYGRGSLPAATRALFTLEAAGINASLLDGGQAAWLEDNRPTSQDNEPVTRGSLSPLKLNPRIVDSAYVQQRLASPTTVIIDARDPQFYSGAQAGFQAPPNARGHIQGAKSMTYSTLVGPEGTLKSAEEIAAMFKAAGVDAGDEVIAYCHVGQQATVIMLGAKLAGVKAVLYDGSYQDWSNKGLPVEAAPAAGPR